MCGIAGWIDWEKDLTKQVEVLERMSATLARRGPDEKGIWLGEHAALAHRRLSIMDPANGKQPMIYKANGRHVVLVYNGELYNYPEIRADLEKLGHTFRSHCDTEAVLYAFVEWGVDCVLRFDGIFAFGAWDEGRQELALARDRLGVKPLFFTQRGGSFLFGSEIKTLLAHPLVPPEVDADGLCELIVSCPPGFAGTPGVTPYRGVHELRPGHHMMVTRGGVKDTTYWKLVSKPHEDDAATTARRVRELLGGAVERQMASDVPLASLLSGGLDSSVISALAAGELKKTKKHLQTWCVDFVEADRDFFKTPAQSSRDAPFAKEAADFLGAEHHNVVLDTSQMLGGLLDCMRARDLPISHQHDTSLLLLFRELKKGATVALSGEASDEIFGGYRWFWHKGHDEKAFQWTFGGFKPHTSAEVTARIKPTEYMVKSYEAAVAEVPRLGGESEVNATFRQNVYFNMTRFLGYLLARKDRLGMYEGVEGRVPFCDHRLVEYMWNVPPDLQRIDGVEKTLLRRAIANDLPDSIVNRVKSVFPFFEHVEYLKGIRKRALEIVEDASSPAPALFDLATIRQHIAGDLPPNYPPSATVTLLERFIQFDGWIREYKISFV